MLGGRTSLTDPEQGVPEIFLEDAGEALEVFNGGVVLADREGAVIAASEDIRIRLGPGVADLEVFRSVREIIWPRPLAILQEIGASGDEYFIVAVPLGDGRTGFSGALLGILDLRTAAFGEPLRRLTAGEARHAYLVDRNGTIVFHPDAAEIGRDLGDRPFVNEMSAGQSGGLLVRGPDGERLVEGFAPIPGTSWGLIVQEVVGFGRQPAADF